MRKRCHRRQVVPMPPRGLRPKLSRDQVLDLKLAHIANLDALASPNPDVQTMIDFAGSALCWSEVVKRMHRRDPERFEEALALLGAQCLVATEVIERFRTTGLLGFSGLQYQTARDACAVMDELAEIVDLCDAEAAADASQAWVDRAFPREAS